MRFAKRRRDTLSDDFELIVTWAPTTPINSQRCGRPFKMPQSADGFRLTTGGR
jgi:hypothetical protein